MEARKQKAQNTTISNIESGKMATALNSQKILTSRLDMSARSHYKILKSACGFLWELT